MRALARRQGDERRFSLDTWLANYLIPSGGNFLYNGSRYPYGYPTLNQTWNLGGKVQEIAGTLPGYSAALRACPPAFTAQAVRALVLSGARFTFRNLPSSATPRRIFGTQALAPLETPWPQATTADLISRAEWHAGLAGNSYTVRQPNRLRVLRPDWTALVFGSQQEPEEAAHALDGELVGYAYCNGGIAASNRNEIRTLLPDEVAHWAPIPDPENAGIGMSWLTPVIRELQADWAATEHKLRFFVNGATPNLVIKGIPAATKTEFDDIVAMLEEAHTGLGNAYRTLYLTQGADATVVGSNLQQMDFKAVQGGGETRISMASRVHPVILASAEGLQGSALNAGNFGMARRIWADTWIYPTLQGLAGTLASIVDVPLNPKNGLRDSELWFDTADMPILREDAKDAAEIQQIQATTITTLIKEGYQPDAAITAVIGQNMSTLVGQHTGLVSVQLQPPATVAQRAQIMNTKAQTVNALVHAGYDPDTVVDAVDAADVTKLQSTDLVPKQLIEDPSKVGGEPGVPVFGSPTGSPKTSPSSGSGNGASSG